MVILVNTDPRNGEELGAPFYHAAVAAALDHEVDIVCTATAGRLLRRGVAENLRVKPGSARSVLDFMRDAHQAGARLWACPANLDLFEMTADELIPECSGLMGVAAMMEIVMAEGTRVLTY
jgi:predicted peroxiredoxin